MAINLVKGERVEIGLSKLKVEMGWKVNPNAQPPYDLDASTFLLRANGEIGVEEDFVFYGSNKTVQAKDDNGNLMFKDGKPVMRPISADDSVLGSVDDLGDDDDNTGEGNEEIEIDLSRTNQLINEIIFTASIYWRKGEPSERYNFRSGSQRLHPDSRRRQRRGYLSLRPRRGLLDGQRRGVRTPLPPQRRLEIRGCGNTLRRRSGADMP